MAKSSLSSGLRTRALSAALITLGCSLGVGLTPAMLAAEKPTEAGSQKLDANQMKERAALAKAVEEDKALLNADHIKLTAFEKSLSSDVLKLPANQQKLKALKSAIEADQWKLQAHQQKLDAATRK